MAIAYKHRVVAIQATNDVIRLTQPLRHRGDDRLEIVRHRLEDFIQRLKRNLEHLDFSQRHRGRASGRMIEEGKLDTTPWITDRMALTEVPRLLQELPGKPSLIKALVELDDSDG